MQYKHNILSYQSKYKYKKLNNHWVGETTVCFITHTHTHTHTHKAHEEEVITTHSDNSDDEAEATLARANVEKETREAR